MSETKINKNTLIKEYDNAVSYIRLTAMIMIIVCHFMQYYEMELAWWLNVGVQVFFIMSGFLYGNKDIDNPVNFWERQIRKILVPYWVIVIIVSLIHKLFIPTTFSWGKVLSAIFCIGKIPGMEHLWFVSYILICYLLSPYLYYLKNAMTESTLAYKRIIVIGLFASFQFIGFTFNGYDMVPNRITCFVVGFFLSILRDKKETIRRGRIIICLLALIGNVIRIYGMYITKIEGNLIFDLFIRYAHGFLGVAIFLLLYKVFGKTKGSVVSRFSDQYSYQIYLVHQVFILGPLSMMRLTENIALNILLICCCIFISGVLLGKITMQINRMINYICNKTFKHIQTER